MSIFIRPAAAASRYSFGPQALIVAACYAALVAATAAVVAAVSLLSDEPGFIGIWLVMVSAPTSFLLLWLVQPVGLEGPAAAVAMVLLCVGGGLYQAWACWRLCRGGSTPSAAPAAKAMDGISGAIPGATREAAVGVSSAATVEAILDRSPGEGSDTVSVAG